MPSLSLIHRTLNGRIPESQDDLVLPRDNPHKTLVAAVHPTLFSIEAAANEESSPDRDEGVLLGIKNIKWTNEIQEPKYPRWMHLSHDEIDFTTFVRYALNAYGLGKEADAVLTSSAFHRYFFTFEKSAFQGKRLQPGHSAIETQLSGQTTKLKINFMAVPYFSLQKARTPREDDFHSSRMCWVQPLVQSAYHLDSSAARESQQSVRRLYRHVTEIIHVPQLWVLNIGDKFIATCSPTPLCNDQQSAITTSRIGQIPFPPTIRVTLISGSVFYLDRRECLVWFKFLHHLTTTIEASLNTTINQKGCTYTLQNDNSSIQARLWQSILRSHPENEPLLILLNPAGSESPPERTPVAIPLEGKYPSAGVGDPTQKESTTEFPAISTKDLSPKTLDEYKLPYYWDSPRPGEQRKIIIAQHLTDLDRRILVDHTRRIRATQDSDFPETTQRGHDDNIYYTPPPYVLEAAKSQMDSEDAETQHTKENGINQSTDNGAQTAAGNPTLSIFRWPITKYTPKINRDNKYDPYATRITKDRPMKNVPAQIEVSAADDPTPTQRMKSLLAHIHREILFSSDTRSSKNYNSLPLKTKSDVDRGIARLRESKDLNSHILALFSSFARHVGYVLDYFIDKDYDCIVKGKAWAAVHELVMSATSSSDALFTFHCEIFSIPVRKFMSQIEELRDGLSGAKEYYITQSMVKALIQFVLLLADSAFEASRLLKSTSTERESPDTHGDKTEDEPKDPSTWPDFLDHSVYANTMPGPPIKIIDRRDVRADPYEEDDTFVRPPRRRYAGSEESSGSQRRRYPWNRREDAPLSVNDHVNQIFAYLDDAHHECCAMFSSKDDKPVYGGVDCGRIISLVMDSVLRGHSACESIPVLDIEEIYTTWTTSLQLEARNRPSKALLMDISLLREELKIITNNINQQSELVSDLCQEYDPENKDTWEVELDDNACSSCFESLYSTTHEGDFVVNMATRKKLKDIQGNLQDRQDVFEELRTRVDSLESQIIQRVDIIQEDHGKAILVFTIVSTIFLPLSFVSSYMGMNTSDIRDMEPSQALFWQAATPFTVVVVVAVLVVAYNIHRIQRWLPRGPAVP